MLLAIFLLVAAAEITASVALQKRNIVVSGKNFVKQGTNDVVLLEGKLSLCASCAARTNSSRFARPTQRAAPGANVVMKGYPWIPPVKGLGEDQICADHWYRYACALARAESI